MMTAIKYTNNRGESMEFGGADGSLHYLEHELRDWEWSYSTGSASGRVSSFSRRPSKPKKVKFPVGIAAQTAEEGIALRNRLLLIGESDVAATTPGTLSIGDWSLRCWICSGEPGKYWQDDRYAEFTLQLLVEDPGWVRETARSFVPVSASVDEAEGDDFPIDFPFDLAFERPSATMDVAGTDPQPFLWRVFGPAANPYLRIVADGGSGNLYRVNATIPAGCRMEVDSRAKTVVMIGPEGQVTNLYGSRERGTAGSGSYIFEDIPAGRLSVAWPNDYRFDLVTYEVRSAVPYEED